VTKPRKPLRRTAWGMLLGGIAGTALMLGTGAIAVLSAPPAGPGQVATWPAGETASLARIPFEPNSGESSTTCTVTPQGRPAQRNPWLPVGRPMPPDFSGSATITCDQPLALLSGTGRVVADLTRGPWITLPLFVAFLGLLLFFPRFTHHWASFATSGWLRRLLRNPRPPD
jgi:hypothetical protein